MRFKKPMSHESDRDHEHEMRRMRGALRASQLGKGDPRLFEPKTVSIFDINDNRHKAKPKTIELKAGDTLEAGPGGRGFVVKKAAKGPAKQP